MERQTLVWAVPAFITAALLCAVAVPPREDGAAGREYDGFLPVHSHEREGHLNVEGAASLSILARRGAELLRVELEVVEN
jgi:hypothetical protein